MLRAYVLSRIGRLKESERTPYFSSEEQRRASRLDKFRGYNYPSTPGLLQIYHMRYFRLVFDLLTTSIYPFFPLAPDPPSHHIKLYKFVNVKC